LAINGECGALHGAAMLASSLRNGEGAPVDRAIANYARIVVDTEWPMMAKRERSPQAAAAIHAAIGEAANLKDTGPVEVSMQAEIVSLLAQAHAFRETRTYQLAQGMPTLMWVMLIAISLVLVCFVIFAGLSNPGHILFAATFTACTVLVLVLVRMLDFPFEGALALNDADFVKLLGQATALARGAPG
jgi:multidrug efflux pump subunit AcrB